MKFSKLSILSGAAAVPIAAAMLASAAGPNLVQNGDFSAGMNGWTNWGGPSLVQNQVVNGELEVKNIYTGSGNSYVGVTQCIVIEPGADYTVSADAFIANGQTLEAGAGIYVFFRPETNCTGQNMSGGHVLRGKQNGADRGAWINLTRQSSAPANAKAMAVYFDAVKEPLPQNYATGVPQNFTVLFDNLSVTKVTPAPQPQPDPQPQPQPQPEEPAEEETPPTPEPPKLPTPPQIPQVPQVPEIPEIPFPFPLPEVPVPPAPVVTPPAPPVVTPPVVQPQQPSTPASAPQQPSTPVVVPEPAAETPAPLDVPLPPDTGNAAPAEDPAGAATGFLIAAVAGMAAVAGRMLIRGR